MHTNDVSIAEMESCTTTSASGDDGLGRRSFPKGMGVTGAAALSGSLPVTDPVTLADRADAARRG